MSDIDELQRRITAALDRIAQGLEQRGTATGTGEGPAPDEIEALESQLEDERLANAQLAERVRKMKEQLARLEAAAIEARGETAARMEKLDHELQSLRKANQQLRESNEALRAANSEGVGEPHLINKSMLAELEGLRASRASDRAETDTILAEMGRILSDGPHDQTQQEDA
ncbi:hypothetical protein BXY70_0542 [Roseovarius halotolerans]|uniref:Chromosome partition protein Smc n=1 Tax=Roseovarius halotolerans TaxID=505353 RepID=A0A1X6YIG4_9RHOB|nr:hypothetical protein [Roseovarius halotolerans]RKT34524.1 hypothetical protein BXY70_0542 [Roseovarius halotolerans]SLN22315.1 hypothetical protein ROH8110_00853 [Roseovarius halotolerans]